MVYCCNQIEKLYGAQGLHAMSLHPGGIESELQCNTPKTEFRRMGWFAPDGQYIYGRLLNKAQPQVSGLHAHLTWKAEVLCIARILRLQRTLMVLLLVGMLHGHLTMRVPIIYGNGASKL
jgi:hypothetical protein